jgi:hypothetical protein
MDEMRLSLSGAASIQVKALNGNPSKAIVQSDKRVNAMLAWPMSETNLTGHRVPS